MSRGQLWSSFLFGLLTVGQGGTGTPADIRARHIDEATWIAGHGGLRGLREDPVRRQDSACAHGRRFDAEIAAAMPRFRPASWASGAGKTSPTPWGMRDVAAHSPSQESSVFAAALSGALIGLAILIAVVSSSM